MPGFLLHLGATVMCAHGGQATPTSPYPRVRVSGQPIVTQAVPHAVAGCPFNVSGAPVPCVTAQWVMGAVRVRDAGHHREHAGAGKGAVMQVDYPFHFDGRGRTAQTDPDDHIRDLIEQVLFTAPGERVNRPTFGSGLLELVFQPNSDALASVTQMSVQGALHLWLGDLIQVEAVEVESDDSTLRVSVQYTVRRTQQRQVAQFERGS
jgi:phage baseplate assembly protein W